MNGIQRKLAKFAFQFRARSILRTPRVHCKPGVGVVLVSQLYSPDLLMFLVAAKSFLRFCPVERIIIVDDGLTAGDKSVLEAHFSDIRFFPRLGIPLSSCPSGGCWERFLTLADAGADGYVIQLDSDTVTVAEPVAVLECIRENRTFTLGTPGGREITSLSNASEVALGWSGAHVQTLAEQALPKLSPGLGNRYVHGCAGFTGFPQGILNRPDIERFSTEMSQLLGPQKWAEWGSEQVASNFFAANAPGARVLPVDEYPFWRPGIELAAARLIHFFGTHRYEKGVYASCAQQVSRDLSRQG